MAKKSRTEKKKPEKVISGPSAMPWSLFGLLTFLIFLVYAVTAPHTVTMEDSGEFLASAFSLGIPHPPGYPTYIILGKFFSLLPFGTVAFKIHLLSALLGALACGFIFLTAYVLTSHRWISFLTGILAAAGQVFWSQSVIAEVYSLNALFFFALFWLGLLLLQSFTKRRFSLFAFLLGLSLTNSWPLMVLAVPSFIALLWRVRDPVLKNFLSGLAFVALGLMPYLLLLWMPRPPLEISFMPPFSDLSDLIRYVLRKEYAADNAQALVGWLDKLQFLKYFLILQARELSYVGMALLGAGFVFAFQTLPRSVFFALLLAYLSSSVFLLFVWHVEFNLFMQQVDLVFHLVPFGIGAVLCALALARYKFGLPAAIALAVFSLVFGFSKNNLRDESLAYDYSKLLLERLPPNSVLIVWGDADTGPLAYTSLVAKIRPDVLVTSQMGVLFKDRIFDRKKDVSDQVRAERTVQFIQKHMNEGRRVFTTRKLIFQEVMRGFPYFYTSIGLAEEIVKQPTPVTPDLDFVEKVKPVLDRVALGEESDYWSYHKGILVRRMCRLLAQNKVEHLVFKVRRECKLAWLQQLYEVEKNYAGAEPLLHEVLQESEGYPIADQNDVARLLMVNKAQMINQMAPEQRTLELHKVISLVEPYAKRQPNCENRLALSLLELLSQVQVPVDMGFFRKSFGNCPQHRFYLDKIKY